MFFLKSIASIFGKHPELRENMNLLTRWETDVQFNGDFYYTNSKTRDGMPDPDGVEHYLPPDCSNQVLGAAVSDALMRCVGLTLFGVAFAEFFEQNKKRYYQWIDGVIIKYGYKNRTALFKNMIACRLVAENGIIKIAPTNHDRLDAWGSTLDDDFADVEIPMSSTAEELGKAVRIAFSRCLNPYGDKRGLAPHNFDAFIKGSSLISL